MSWPVRLALAVYVAGFGYGTYTHAADFIRWGWWSYRFEVEAIATFWNLLVFLDAAVVVLLLAGWRRAGLVLALLIMIVDVGVNSYAAHLVKFAGFNFHLTVQAAFLGFIVGSIAFVWPRR